MNINKDNSFIYLIMIEDYLIYFKKFIKSLIKKLN